MNNLFLPYDLCISGVMEDSTTILNQNGVVCSKRLVSYVLYLLIFLCNSMVSVCLIHDHMNTSSSVQHSLQYSD